MSHPLDVTPLTVPASMGRYEFAVVSALRTHQLMAGCRARIAAGGHKATTTACMEVAGAHVARLLGASPSSPTPVHRDAALVLFDAPVPD